MIGILIVTHYGLGESLIQCASHVMIGRPPKLEAVGVGLNDDPAVMLQVVQARVQALDDGSGVLVLCDLFGATPGNVAQRVLVPGHVEGIAGASVPMLVRALTYRHEPLKTVVAKAMSGGVEGVFKMPPVVENATAGS